MFAQRYFASRYFASRYFPQAGAGAAIPPDRCSLQIDADDFLAVDAQGRLAISTDICVVVPTAEGLDYAIAGARMHYVLTSQRLHYVLPPHRSH